MPPNPNDTETVTASVDPLHEELEINDSGDVLQIGPAISSEDNGAGKLNKSKRKKPWYRRRRRLDFEKRLSTDSSRTAGNAKGLDYSAEEIPIELSTEVDDSRDDETPISQAQDKANSDGPAEFSLPNNETDTTIRMTGSDIEITREVTPTDEAPNKVGLSPAIDRVRKGLSELPGPTVGLYPGPINSFSVVSLEGPIEDQGAESITEWAAQHENVEVLMDESVVEAFEDEFDDENVEVTHESFVKVVSRKPWYYHRPFIIVSALLLIAIVIAISVLVAKSRSSSKPDTSTAASPEASRSPTVSTMQTFTPTAAPTSFVLVTVLIQLDNLPEETGWMLACDGVEYENVAAGTYTVPNQLVSEQFPVVETADCKFIITDTYEDGICCSNGEGFFQLYIGDDPTVQNNLIFEGGEFGPAAVHRFIAVEASPTASPAPSGSPVPSAIPTASPATTQVLWLQLGQDIEGDTETAEAGTSVSLSLDSRVLAIGQAKDGAGSVKVLRYSTGSKNWEQLGSTVVGEIDGAEFGYSVSLSGDCLVVGGRFNDGNNKRKAGHVRVFRFDMDWTLTAEFHGTDIEDFFGSSVSINTDCSIMASGAPGRNGRGYVRVYQNSGEGVWSQIGQDTVGSAVGSEHGFSVSLSRNNGSVVAVGSPSLNGVNGDRSGNVRVFKRNGQDEWVQIGQELVGDTKNAYFGRALSISADGSILAIGAEFSGLVRVFQFDAPSENWVQMGDDITGKDEGDQFGRSVALSFDGLEIGIGALTFDTGYVQMYQYAPETQKWEKVGQDIEGGAQTGFSVSVSRDASIVSFGAPRLEGPGVVKVYTRSGG